MLKRFYIDIIGFIEFIEEEKKGVGQKQYLKTYNGWGFSKPD